MKQQLDIVVLLGDPRLPYAYNLSNRFESHDFEAMEALKAALGELPAYRFDFLDDHSRFYAALSEAQPSLVLNLCNTGFANRIARQLHVPALLEILEIPYAGAGPECLSLCHDKAMVMDIADDMGIPVPEQRFVQLLDDTTEILPPRYPAFIKPNDADGSIGVERDAVVRNDAEARECLKRLAGQFDRPAVLMQEYLPGAEHSVAIIGNQRTGFTPLPPLEIDFSELDPSLPPILTYDSKVDPESAYWRKIHLRRADMAPDVVERVHDHCCRLFERLGCRDYARFDFRRDSEGEPHLIDVNAHPMWTASGMMATVAGFGGYSYRQLLELIIDSARKRLEI